jgi:hypothetical protein
MKCNKMKNRRCSESRSVMLTRGLQGGRLAEEFAGNGSQTEDRPELSAGMRVEEFEAWYWLKEELVGFCRRQGISPTGSKPELLARISALLAGRTSIRFASPKRNRVEMPTEFTLETVIGEGWRCGPKLGGFLRQVVGSGFRFNAETRDFIHHGSGKTLADAALCYQESVRPGREKSEIPEQLEYNRHFREFFRAHPDASRDEAIAAWWSKRSRRKTAP